MTRTNRFLPHWEVSDDCGAECVCDCDDVSGHDCDVKCECDCDDACGQIKPESMYVGELLQFGMPQMQAAAAAADDDDDDDDNRDGELMDDDADDDCGGW